MITPEDNIPLDDSSNSESEDQQSQKDIHSNGFEEEVTEEKHASKDLLNEAYKASEASYTLNIDEDKTHEKDRKTT